VGSAIVEGWPPFAAAALLTPVIVWRGRRRGVSAAGILVRLALLGWAAVLVSLTLFPLPLPPYPELGDALASRTDWPWPWASLVPLRTLLGAAEGGWAPWDVKYLLGNIAAFVPLGLLVPVASTPRSWRRVLVLGFACSLAVETMQLAGSLAMGFPWRVFDVDDILLNATGTVVGFVAWRIGSAGWSLFSAGVGTRRP
jgi:glycopeptide antibiotics resistance protein